MSTFEVVAVIMIILLAVGWRLTWLATRVDRAHFRVERTWGALDAALVRRAQRATEVASDGVDPATTLLVCDAAAAALEPDLDRAGREQAESNLSHVLDLVALPGVELEQDRAALARHLHNDAVRVAQSLRRRRTVTWFRLAGHAAQPQPFEMAEQRHRSRA